jgi:class 3 adenylate cyclase
VPHYSAVSPIVVGRDVELAAVAQTLDRVRTTGDAELFLLSGPAGMGKSRMVAETLRLAAAAGLTRLEGHCTPEADIPYGALVSALRRRTRTMDVDDLAALFNGPAALAATLLPEVADAVGPTPTPRAADDLFASTWRLLARMVRPQAGLLVLEDLHWADAGTLKLLDYLAHEREGLPLLVVGTYRSDEMHRRHPLSLLIADLTRDRRFTGVELAPLTAPQAAEMLSAIFEGTEVSEDFARAVTERTDGNPFFLEELMKVMVERGDVYRTAEDWESRGLDNIEMPVSVRETLLARARTMDPASVRILEVAALDRVTLDVDVLQLAADVEPEQVDDAIREGLALQILEERRDGGHLAYSFRHALSREAFADELVGPDRRRAHLALARAIETVHADRLDDVAARLAEHCIAAQETAAAAEHCLRAARYASATMSDDDADLWFDQAIRLLPDGDRRMAVLDDAIGQVNARLTPMKGAFADELRRVANERGDAAMESRALDALATLAWVDGKGAESLAFARQGLDVVRGKDAFAEAWAVARLTRNLSLGDALELDDPLLDEGAELASVSGNMAALSSIRGTQMMLTRSPAEFDQRRDEAATAAVAAGSDELEANVHLNGGYICLWTGRFDRSAESLARGAAIFDRIAPSDGYSRAGLAWLLSLRGDYDRALELATPWRAARRLPDRVVALTALAEVGLRRDLSDVEHVVDELWTAGVRMDESQRAVPAAAARARLALMRDGVDVSLPLFLDAMSRTLGPNMRGSHWPFSPDLAAALATEGRASGLRDWSDRVDRATEADRNPHNVAAAALVRAHLASIGGDELAASLGFQDAIDRYAALPAPARVAEAHLGLTRAQARSGEIDAATRSLESAERIATELASPPLLADVERTRHASISRPVLATLLFTDIVDSTQQAVALGDRAWRDLLERHHGIVRRELARHGGREIDTAGDGFLAAFDSPASGVRCAQAAQDALAEAGIRIRAGLHTGECHESGGKLTGLTVHIAARVGSAATGGEVVVSSTVRELMAGSGLTFTDRGVRELKGVPGEWHLYAVERGTATG